MSRFVPRALRGQPTDSEPVDEFSARRREAEEPEAEAATAADASAEETAAKPAAPARRRPTPRAAKPAPEAAAEDEAEDEAAEVKAAASETADAETDDAETDAVDETAEPDDEIDVDDEDVESESGGRSRRGGEDRARSRKSGDSAGAGKSPGKRGSAGRKVVAPRVRMSRRAKAAQAAVARIRRTALAVGIWALIFAVLAGVAFYLKTSQAGDKDAEREATTAAAAAAKAIFSYDHRTFDQSVSNGLTFTTGDFRKEYRKTTKSLEATAKKEKAIVVADVKAVSVADKPKDCPGGAEDCVDVLLYVNQIRSNVNIKGQKADQNRVVLTMVKVRDPKTGEDDWLVDGALAI